MLMPANFVLALAHEFPRFAMPFQPIPVAFQRRIGEIDVAGAVHVFIDIAPRAGTAHMLATRPTVKAASNHDHASITPQNRRTAS